MVDLSRDADKMICVLYKQYLTRRENGMVKSEACQFDDVAQMRLDFFPYETIDDLNETLIELCRAFDFDYSVDGSFVLSDQAIIYMEGRFKRNLKAVLDYLAQFLCP